MKKWLSYFSLLDCIIFIFLLLLIYNFLIHSSTQKKYTVLYIYAGIYAFHLAFIFLRRRIRVKKIFHFISLVYPLLVVGILFYTLSITPHYFNSKIYDHEMSHIDVSLFGIHPTIWMERFIHPIHTEIMYLFYFIYFPLPFPLIYYFFLDTGNKEKLERMLFTFFICYFGAFLFYFLIPVQGPRFYLESQYHLELQGRLFTDPIRDLINVLEPSKLDCFPSMHTAIGLLVIFLAKETTKAFYIFSIVSGIGILISLIYCRYHYVADIVAGVVWAYICYFAGNALFYKLKEKFLPHFQFPI